MHIASRLQKWVLWLGLLVWVLPIFGQDLNFQVGFSFTSEMTTGSISGKRNDPMDLLRTSRFTYKPEVNIRMNVLPWLGMEAGIYQKDRGLGIKTPLFDSFGNTIGYSNLTTHNTYLGFPLRLHLKWEELYFAAGPALEMLTGLATYRNGQLIPTTDIPSRTMEIALGCQLGWEAQLTPGIFGFASIQFDAQWLRPLRPAEYRYASIGVAAGLRFGIPKLK